MALLTIGQVSRRSGVAPSTLRFYEDLGLISSIRPAPGSRRSYRRDMLRRIAFIQVTQMAGLSLSDIGALLNLLPCDRTPTEQDWAGIADALRPQLDHRLHDLETMRSELDDCRIR